VLSGDALEERSAAWKGALESIPIAAVPAADLYSGDHWQVVRKLADGAPPDITVRVWVASAGYGLVELKTPLKPYAATFARGHDDSVVPPNAAFASPEWWGVLAEWKPSSGPSVRSLTELARAIHRETTSFLLVAISGSYLTAMVHDLEAAATLLRDRIGLLSVGAPPPILDRSALIRDIRLSVDARLKTDVGGAMQSLNVRLARLAISEASLWFPHFERLAKNAEVWMARSPEFPREERARHDDDYIRSFISEALRVDGRVSRSALLRRLRSSGHACEQRRFATLYQETVTERFHDGSVHRKNVRRTMQRADA
jgi:hypothetical protein